MVQKRYQSVVVYDGVDSFPDSTPADTPHQNKFKADVLHTVVFTCVFFSFTLHSIS